MATANFASATIWAGDNLPVIRGMNSACVDLIYLVPPFTPTGTRGPQWTCASTVNWQTVTLPLETHGLHLPAL